MNIFEHPKIQYSWIIRDGAAEMIQQAKKSFDSIYELLVALSGDMLLQFQCHHHLIFID